MQKPKLDDLVPVEGQILTGSLFNEPVRVATVRPTAPETWVLGVVGVSSERYRSVTLTAAELSQLTFTEQAFTYAGDAHLLRLGLQAYALGIAYEYDPYFGLSISRVDPLPHQLEAVYDYLLKLARVRFLLADDAGAGKTIMAGLLISARLQSVAWLNERALMPFLNEIRQEREAEVKRIQEHIDVSLTELIRREDDKIGRFFDEAERGVEGAAGLLKMAEDRHAALFSRRQRRAEELARQRSLSLQGVERVASVLVLPHPERDQPQMQNLHPDPETEAIAMRAVMEYERSQRRQVDDVHEKNLGYDITSLDTSSGELRLIEIKGLAGETGTVALTPNEKRVAEDRRDCYWLYVVTRCKQAEGPRVMPIGDPARLAWHEVKKVEHYQLSVSALTPASSGGVQE